MTKFTDFQTVEEVFGGRNKMDENDLRKKDIDFMYKNMYDWETIWEDSLSNHTSIELDFNQNCWHLSRVSYLAGFLRAQGKETWEISKILDKYLEDLAEKDLLKESLEFAGTLPSPH